RAGNLAFVAIFFQPVRVDQSQRVVLWMVDDSLKESVTGGSHGKLSPGLVVDSADDFISLPLGTQCRQSERQPDLPPRASVPLTDAELPWVAAPGGVPRNRRR